MKKTVCSIIFIFLFSFGNFIFAQNDSTHTKVLMPRPPIYGIPAKTLPKGKFIFRSYLTFSNYTQMFSATKNEMIDLPSGMSFQSYSYTPKFRYGLTKRFTLIANFPLYYKQLKNGSITKSGVGLGDVIVAGLYRFYFNKQQHFLLSGLLFTKYPTGKVNNLQPDKLPLGTGSYDGGIAILPEKEFGKLDLRLSAFYIFRSKNSHKINLGNVQKYSLSAAYDSSKRFISEATILYQAAASNKFNGKIIDNSNTNLSQFIIGAEYRLAPTFLLQAAIPITLSAKTPFKSNTDIWFGIFYLM